MTRTGVKWHFSAAHRQPNGGFHGHTWEVTAWFPDSREDALVLQSRLRTVLSRFDHKTIPDDLSRSEVMAQEIGEELDGCASVLMTRRAEGILAEWTA